MTLEILSDRSLLAASTFISASEGGVHSESSLPARSDMMSRVKNGAEVKVTHARLGLFALKLLFCF